MNQIGGPEQKVITITDAGSITLPDEDEPRTISKHLVTFSGDGGLGDADAALIKTGASDDNTSVLDCSIIVGPEWDRIDKHQVSFIVAPADYSNTNSDEDNQQLWQISNRGSEIVAAGGGTKRIKLNFRMAQRGEETSFRGITYQVTANGELRIRDS